MILVESKTFSKSCTSISLRFTHSFQKDFIKFKEFKRNNYVGDEYILVENSIMIPISILDRGGRDNTLIIPYKYFLNGHEETLYLEKGVTHRSLALNSQNFVKPGKIHKYDMIVSPANLPADQQRDFKAMWRVTFHLYSPVTEILHDNKLVLKFSDIQFQVTEILFSLCYAYMVCKSFKLLVMTKKTYVHLFDSEEEVNSFMRDLLLEWIDSIVNSDFPFHLKFYLSFLTLDSDLMLPCSNQIYFKLFKDINTDFIMPKVQKYQNFFLQYQQDILNSPQLLHRALQTVCRIDLKNLITFLPLYHLVFNSEHSFSEAHNKHDFLNNSYWGLPPDIPFTDSTIEPIILNTLTQYNTLGTILPYSVTLLCLRLEIFLQLLETLKFPFLPFIAVLLYRIDKWDLLARDEQLRITVYETFLVLSQHNPNLMNETHIYQATDVIFKMIHLLEGSHRLPNPLFISFNEANLLLQVLGRLLLLTDRNEPLPSDTIMFNFVSSFDLLTSIQLCIYEQRFFEQPDCDYDCLKELTVWNSLLCIQFPSSYQWVDAVTKTFSKRLMHHRLNCLLNSIIHFCTICTEDEISSKLLEMFRTELNSKIAQSQTLIEDEQLIVESLEKVPRDQFSNVIDVFAEIISLHKSDITGTNPLEHILSLTWLPSVLKQCESSMLTSSNHLEAADLLRQCVRILRNVTSEFCFLTIQVNHLRIVLESKSLYFSILHAIPDIIPDTTTDLLDEDVFKQAIEFRTNLLDFFLRQRMLVQDLEKVLDSTNIMVYSKEILLFLDIDYKTRAISHLCRTSEHKFILKPDNPCLSIFNDTQIKNMLESLPDLLKSQFFLSQFKQQLIVELAEMNLNRDIGLSTIHYRIFVPTFDYVSKTISDLFSHNILISTINKHFARYMNCTELMRAEINHIITAIERTSEESYKPFLDETMRKVDCYFSLQKSQNIAVRVLKVRDSYGFTGEFANTEFLSNLENLNNTAQLKLVTPELLKTTDSLANFNQTHVNILLTLLKCVNLFTWTAGILKKPSDLDDFIDIALNSVDNTAVQINRITCFKSPCIMFSPFPFQHQDIDEVKFLQNLQEVYDKVSNRDESADYLLKMSQDCARESEITFWKEIQFSLTSIGGKTISQLKQIMQYGKFVLTTTMDTHTVEDVLKLYDVLMLEGERTEHNAGRLKTGYTINLNSCVIYRV